MPPSLYVENCSEVDIFVRTGFGATRHSAADKSRNSPIRLYVEARGSIVVDSTALLL